MLGVPSCGVGDRGVCPLSTNLLICLGVVLPPTQRAEPEVLFLWLQWPSPSGGTGFSLYSFFFPNYWEVSLLTRPSVEPWLVHGN